MSSSRLSHSSLDRVGLNDADYDAIEAAVMETTRGRWFLTEYARRLRRAETETILAALDALGRQIQSQHGLAASYKASARFTSCLQVGIGTPSRPDDPPASYPLRLRTQAILVLRGSSGREQRDAGRATRSASLRPAARWT